MNFDLAALRFPFKAQLFKVVRVWRAYGVRYVVSMAVHHALKAGGFLTEAALLKHQINIDLYASANGAVAHGYFKGMRLSRTIHWGHHDVASKIFGEYERHVLDVIKQQSHLSRIFVDIGAADGYYGVGVLHAGWFEKSFMFEISELGRQVCIENAGLNNVGAKIEVYGKADAFVLRRIVEKSGPCIILCDIEGNEFSLFDDDLLQVLKACVIIIELHGGMGNWGDDDRNKFLMDAERYFDLEFVKRISPRAYDFPDLVDLRDDQRMLLFSEGRPRQMEWVLLSPKT